MAFLLYFSNKNFYPAGTTTHFPYKTIGTASGATRSNQRGLATNSEMLGLNRKHTK